MRLAGGPKPASGVWFCFVFKWKGKARFDGGKLSSRSRRGEMLTWRPGCDWGPGPLSGI